MFVNKNLYRKYLHTFVVLLAMIISLFPISILETSVKAKTTDYTPDKVLTDEMVGNMAGCEAEIKGNEIIIRPKKGAKEGVISYSYKKDDFKALQYIFKKDETENKTLRFEGNIYGYGSLKELFKMSNISSLGNINKFNVSNVTNMDGMFSYCTNITSLEALKDWNVSKVTDMNHMFYDCENITSLEALKDWNVSKVTDMNHMFSICKKMTSLEALKNWNVSNVIDIRYMFSCCHSLGKYNEVVDTLNAWNMSKVDNTDYMFEGIGDSLSLDRHKHKLILDFSNASIKKLSYDTFSDMYGILILNNKNLEYNDSLLENTFLTVTNNENYLNKDKDLKYYRDITLKYGDNKVKKISMPAVYDSKGSKDVYNIIKAEVDKKIKATINELKAEDPSLFLTGEYKNLSTLQEKTLALFGEYELKSQKKESETKVIKAKTKYEADDNLTFNEKKVIKVAEDGQKEVTTKKTLKDGNWVQEGEPKEKVIKPAKDGLTKVGNKEVSTNGDETITKIYEVNPDTGELSNPKVTKTVKMARLVPAQQHHNNQQTMSHTVDTSDHSSLSYYGMFLSALSVLCLILLKKEKLN